jgi:23S rRNA pseudouridine1911/1915/1917 synthase
MQILFLFKGVRVTDYIVPENYQGVLLKTFLKNHLLLSRALVSALKREQGLRVNGECVTVRYVLSVGDIVSVSYEDKESNEKIIPANIPINVVFEDEDVIIVNKPPFMPVHPSHGHMLDTLANALCYRYKDDNFVMRAVNRLDRNTSGLVLVARNRRSSAILSNQMKKREIGKEYTALVCGCPPEEFIIETYMKRKGESVIERCVCEKHETGAEYALTEGKICENGKVFVGEKEYALVNLVPHTGRTHQLRVHMAHLGFPIAGDELYGFGERFGDYDGEIRHMLHCSMLEFIHPSTGEKMRFVSKYDFDSKNTHE